MGFVDYNLYAIIRDQIKNSDDYLDMKKLNLKLTKFDTSLIQQTVDYLIKSNKVILSKDKKLIWVFADTSKSKRLLKECVRVA